MPEPIVNGEAGSSVRAKINAAFSDLDGKAATAHDHAIANVTGLQTALDGKAATAHDHAIANVTGLQTALDGKAATAHDHAIANVTGLQTALDGKAATAHDHAIANVTGLQTALDGKQATLVSGTNVKTVNGETLLGEGNIVVSGGGGAIGIEDVTGLQTALDEKLSVEDATPVVLRATELLSTDDFMLLRGGVPYLVAPTVMASYFGSAPAATAPAAMTVGQWSAEPTATPGEIGINIDTLPSDGGSAITALEYRVGTGAAVALAGTGTGLRVVTAGFTAGVAAAIQVRAVNAVGAADWSDVKTRTPAAASGPTLIQATPVFSDGINVSGSFASAVTPGNTIIIYGSSHAETPTITTSQGDTVVSSVHAYNNARSILAYVNTAVGGATTITFTVDSEQSRFFAEEWSGIEFDSAAGVGQLATQAVDMTVSTSGSASSSAVLTVTVWSVHTGGGADNQTPPTGYTEVGRSTSADNSYPARIAQFIGARRTESDGGVKSAPWVRASEGGDFNSLQIAVFRSRA